MSRAYNLIANTVEEKRLILVFVLALVVMQTLLVVTVFKESIQTS